MSSSKLSACSPWVTYTCVVICIWIVLIIFLMFVMIVLLMWCICNVDYMSISVLLVYDAKMDWVRTELYGSVSQYICIVWCVCLYIVVIIDDMTSHVVYMCSLTINAYVSLLSLWRRRLIYRYLICCVWSKDIWCYINWVLLIVIWYMFYD